jgi:DNA-binding beta-propeller fold protein YncE
VRGRFQSDLSFDSVTISPDGVHLYAVSVEAGKVLALDPASGAMTSSITIASHQPWVVLGIT